MSGRYALLIGNDQYHDKSLGKISAPTADVHRLESILKNPELGEFDQIDVLLNEDSVIAQRKIVEFFSGKKVSDFLLFYFSGHGVLDDRGRLFFTFPDTELEVLRGTSIASSFIADEMDNCRSKRQVVILDCCHSGAFMRGSKGIPNRAVDTAQIFKGSGSGRVIMTASDATQYAFDGDKVLGTSENSLFTHYLIDGIQNGAADLDRDGYISISEIFDYIYENVTEANASQTPLKWAFKEQGNIYLAKCPLNLKKKQAPTLPLELLTAIESPISSVRRAAVAELKNMLDGSNPELAELAHEQLTRMSGDDSRVVSTAAEYALGVVGAGKPDDPQPGGVAQTEKAAAAPSLPPDPLETKETRSYPADPRAAVAPSVEPKTRSESALPIGPGQRARPLKKPGKSPAKWVTAALGGLALIFLSACLVIAWFLAKSLLTPTPTPTLTFTPTPTLIAIPYPLYEDFSDGDIDSNPSWTPNNPTYRVMDGKLFVDGLIIDQSDTYANSFTYPLTFSSTDYLEMSYVGLLKSTGNPQNGRGTILNLASDGDGYHLSIQNGYTNGFPTNKSCISIVIAANSTLQDLVTTTFSPNPDQFYTVKAVRQNGKWYLYVDDTLIGSDVDPINKTTFNAIQILTVGSVVIDDITVADSPTRGIGFTQVSPQDDMVMVYVPAGEFWMGSDKSADPQADDDELPQHRVYLDAYWIDQTEVTNAMYARCVADGACTPPAETRSFTRDSYYSSSQFGNYPVLYMDWNQSSAYCAWAGRRLPTEAEWEKAARGTDGRIYPWGDEFSCSKGNFDDETQSDADTVPGGPNCDGYPDTAPVGSYPAGASPYGALDMAGNVWEWVADWHGAYPSGAVSNPTGPDSGYYRVLRGGSWDVGSDIIRAAYRGGFIPDNRYINFGFRCAR